MTSTVRPVLNVLRTGPLAYEPAVRLQTLLAERCLRLHRQQPAASDVLVLTEHAPVYTVGLRSAGYSADEERRLRALGADFRRTNRGGLITFHGPGQLVAYPIVHLRHFRPSVRWFVCALERSVIAMCQRLAADDATGRTASLAEARTSSDTGVWIGERKLCAIGVHASRYVTTHGLALNCDTDLGWFGHIVPCGLAGKGVTSLSRECGRPFGVTDAGEALLRSVGEVFGCHVRTIGDAHEDAEVLEMLERVRQHEPANERRGPN